MRALEGLSNSGGKQPRDKSAIVGLHMTEFEQESGRRASAGSTSWDAQGWALGEGLCCDPRPRRRPHERAMPLQRAPTSDAERATCGLLAGPALVVNINSLSPLGLESTKVSE